MGLALAEAEKGRGFTSPNPVVGAVLVRNGRQLSLGYHRRVGGPHAEIEALRKVKNARSATLFVTLEPCCHTDKRTPPCVDAIVAAGIRRVVIGCLDPNSKVKGRGIRALRRAGVETAVGVLEQECRELNTYYNHWIQNHLPWVLLKVAASLDGKVALANGKSRWITSPQSRRLAHRIRSHVDGILVGVGTVQADNPRLTARHLKTSRQPLRIILDPALRISERARVLGKNPGGGCCLVVSSAKAGGAKARRLKRRGVEILPCPRRGSGSFDLKSLLKILGKRGLVSLLVEGGPATWSQFIEQKSFQELLLFLAPKLLGGDARSFLGPLGLREIHQGPHLELSYVGGEGPDLVLRYRCP